MVEFPRLPTTCSKQLSHDFGNLGNIFGRRFSDFSVILAEKSTPAIDRFFSISAFRLLSMSQIRWLRPYFMTFCPISKIRFEISIFWDIHSYRMVYIGTVGSGAFVLPETNKMFFFLVRRIFTKMDHRHPIWMILIAKKSFKRSRFVCRGLGAEKKIGKNLPWKLKKDHYLNMLM